MINELKTLSDAIEQAGISTQEWCSEYNPLKTTAPCFILSLSRDGNISNIRFLSKENVVNSGIRTWQGGSNGWTFPAFNFLPFYEYEPEAKSSEKTETYKHFLNDFQNNDVSDNGAIRYADRKKANKKTRECLTQISKDFFQKVLNDDTQSKDLATLQLSLCNFFKEQDDGKDAAEIFNDKLLSFLREKQKTGKIDLKQDEIRDLLFNSKGKNKGDVVLFFDISECTENYIASEALTKEINIRLLKANHSNDSHNCESRDAFGISTDKKKTLEKMPSVKLPGGIDKTYLRSMNPESLCQTRYKTISSESYPVTDDIRKKIKQSLEWIKTFPISATIFQESRIIP